MTHPSGHCCTMVSELGVRLGGSAILRDVSFSLSCGELCAVIGRNGAGKSTLIRALLGELPFTGTISFLSHDGKRGKLTTGYVPQRMPIEPNSPFTVFDLCAAFTSRRPVFLPFSRAARAAVARRLAEFGAEELMDRRVCELSGGQWQRVMLSIAAAPTPELLILDEPTSGIDREGVTLLYEKLSELKRSADMAVLLVSHDLDLLYRYADKALLLEQTVLAYGTPAELWQTAAFRERFGSL